MIHEVEISPEVVRLAQNRTRSMGATLADELARNVVTEAIYNSDPENELLVEEDKAYSSEDALVSAFGVNDIVVNGCRVDVRVIDEEGRVAISRALLNGHYMTAGTLAVEMKGTLNGKVVGFIPAAEWQKLDASAGDQEIVFLRPRLGGGFDFGATMTRLTPVAAPTSAKATPQPFEIATFVANRSELPLPRQRQIVENALAHPQIWGQMEKLVATWSKGSLRRILDDASEWNRRVEKIVDKLAPKFKRVSREDIKKVVSKVGETLGGQPESADFRKTLLATLTREELAHSLGGQALRKASDVAEAVLSGRAAGDVIKDFAKNPVAVELATQIKKQRNRVADFVDATSQELSAAFQQMALQPVYATHSQDPQGAVESVNEALKMLDAGELAESLKELDSELANI
jgi:hypothetical protein